jgi:hypothetical protein
MSEIAGKSQNWAGNFGIWSLSYSGNVLGKNESILGDSYSLLKIGIGLGIGGSVSRTKTTLFKPDPRIDRIWPTIKF